MGSDYNFCRRDSVKHFNISLCCVVFFTAFVSIFGGIFFYVILLFFFKRVSLWGFLFPVLIFSCIAFTQYTTVEQGDYDIIRYYGYYEILAKSTPWEAMIALALFGDYFFYFWVYLLSQIFPEDPRVMSFFFTFATGGMMLLAYRNFATYLKQKGTIKNDRFAFQALLWMIGFVAVISFTNYANVLRQFFALALFFLAVSNSFVHKPYKVLLFLSLLSHWSAVMYIFPFLLLRAHLKWIYVFLTGAFLLGLSGQLSLFDTITHSNAVRYLTGEELGVDKTWILILFIVSILFAWILYWADNHGKIYSLVLIFVMYDFLFLHYSTLTTRFSFGFTQLVVILSPLLFFVVNSDVCRRNTRMLLSVIFSLCFLYHLKSFFLSDFSFLIFNDGNYFHSVYYILCTPFPEEILLY